MGFSITVSNYLHIIAMSTWVGGMLYIVLIEVPVLRRNLDPADFSAQMTLLGKRFQTVGWILLLVLFATGLSNIMLEDSISELMKTPIYTMSIIIKLVLFTLMVLNTALHTFYLGPKMSRLSERMKSSQSEEIIVELNNLRKRSIFSSGFSLILSLVIVYFGMLASKV